MASASTLRRFKFNPVEIAILSVVTVLFGHSVYRLCKDSTADRTAMLTSTSVTPLSEGRKPASMTDATGSPLASINFRCSETPPVEISAQKLRLGGQICSHAVGGPDGLPHETRIVNVTNHYAATVFPDASTLSFTTDYIPLATGANTIRVEFVYKGGKSYSQELLVTKN